MKIESSNYNKVIKKYNNLKKQNLNSKNSSTSEDRIEISKEYNIFKEAMSKLKKMDKTKSSDELNAIADRIKDNSYKIDSLEIAQCIIKKCKK